MISHPGTELALKQTNGDRLAARHLIRAHILAGAERQAEQAGCSMKCATGRHATEPYGCKNDGSGCICACHDPHAGPKVSDEEGDRRMTDERAQMQANRAAGLRARHETREARAVRRQVAEEIAARLDWIVTNITGALDTVKGTPQLEVVSAGLRAYEHSAQIARQIGAEETPS